MSDKLLSLPRGFKKEKIGIGVSNVFISLCSTHRSNPCPVCSTRSSSIHSSYYRHFQDLELAGKRVYINLKVHKFYCRNPLCSRKIFVEDISSLTDKYSRRTNRAQKRILDVSLESSSRKSSYLLSLQGLDVSSSTCVRSVLRSPLPNSKKTQVYWYR